MGKKKVNLKQRFITIILIVLGLGVLGLGGYSHIKFNDEYLESVENINEIKDFIASRIGTEVSSDLNLDFLYYGEEVEIDVKSSKPNIISNEGLVIRPSSKEGNQQVDLEFTIYLKPKDSLKNIYYTLRGNTHKFVINVNVIKAELTHLEILEEVSEQIYVPKVTKSNVGLIKEIPYYENLLITWESSNPSVITSDGNVLNTGSATLEAHLVLGVDEKYLSFDIEVVDEFSDVVEVEEDFSNVSGSESYIEPKEFSGFIAREARIENNALRFRVHTGAEIEYLKTIKNPTRLTLTYEAITSPAFTQDVLIKLMTSVDGGITWQESQIVNINNNEKTFYEFDLSTYDEVKVKLVTETAYATMYIYIDDLKIERKFNEEDVKQAMNVIMPKSVNSSHILPLSTPYGGIIKWQSSDEDVITNDGYVKLTDGKSNVTLTATITGVFAEFTLDFELTVLAGGETLPVEVFFIDVGKYGDADNGEAFYFKIGSIDILVDSGDNRVATRQVLSEVIDENSEDKVIDYVIATHPDADHIGSMKYVFDTYDILNVIYFEGTHTSNLYQTFVDSINNENLVSECTILQSINNQNGCKKVLELAPSVKIEFIDTENYTASDPNGRSIVFVLEAYETRLLMTGDADGASLETKYMNKVGDVDILKMAHHGSRQGTNTSLLEAVDPEYVIITNGSYFGNRHGHPTHEAINRVYQYDSKIEIYAVVGGDSLECTYTTSYRCENQNRFVDRNGTIKLTITQMGFNFTSEYNDTMIELSSTNFWKTHPYREYQYTP